MEVFTSVEGEGILYGTKTLFVRLAGCPFSCGYCDTVEALPADSGEEYEIDEAKALVDDNLQQHTYKVNFTGGEPLVQHRSVAILAKHVRDRGIPTYLESSCFSASRFRHVLPHMDYIKIEFKTPESGFVGAEEHDSLQNEAMLCLKESIKAGRTTYVKVVVGEQTTLKYIQALVRDVFDAISAHRLAGFTIQPVYGAGAPSLALLLQMYDIVHSLYPDVRILPQMHKYLGAP